VRKASDFLVPWLLIKLDMRILAHKLFLNKDVLTSLGLRTLWSGSLGVLGIAAVPLLVIDWLVIGWLWLSSGF
jgi:hypothetical protein